MASVPYYLAALASFTRPATHAEVHRKAVEMYGSAVKGERSSARGSLDRFVLLGKVKRTDGGEYWIEGITDPIDSLKAKLKAAEAEVESLKAQIRRLEGWEPKA
jgi:hypothetical protein